MLTAKIARDITNSFYDQPNFQADITKINTEIRNACMQGHAVVSVKVDHPEWTMAYMASLGLAGFKVSPGKYGYDTILIEW